MPQYYVQIWGCQCTREGGFKQGTCLPVAILRAYGCCRALWKVVKGRASAPPADVSSTGVSTCKIFRTLPGQFHQVQAVPAHSQQAKALLWATFQTCRERSALTLHMSIWQPVQVRQEPLMHRDSHLIMHLQEPSLLQNPAQGAHHASPGLQSVAHALVDDQIHIPA